MLDPAEGGPSSVLLEIECDTEDKINNVISATDSIHRALINSSSPRVGCVTYVLSRECKKDVKKVYLMETFMNLNAWLSHVTEAEGEAIEKLFHSIDRRLAGAVNPPTHHDGVMSGLKSLGAKGVPTLLGHVVNPYPAQMRGGRWGGKVLANGNEAMSIELRIDPKDMCAREKVLEAMTPFTKITNDPMCFLSTFVVPVWWTRAPSAVPNFQSRGPTEPSYASKGTWSEHALSLNIVYVRPFTALYRKDDVRALVECVKAASHHTFTITASDWTSEPLAEFIEYFEDVGLPVSHKRQIIAGHLIHPCYTKDGFNSYKFDHAKVKSTTSGNTKTEQSLSLQEKGNRPNSVPAKEQEKMASRPKTVQPKPTVAPTMNKGAVKSTITFDTTDDPDALPFEFHLDPVTGAAESVSFRRLTNEPPAPPNTVSIPLIHVLQKVASVGPRDSQVPVGFLYGVLERLRFLQSEATTLCATPEADILASEALQIRWEAFMVLLSTFGYSMPVGGPVPVVIRHLNVMIEHLEDAYHHIIDDTKAAIEMDMGIQYMGLQELYRIGSYVTSRSIGALAGSVVALRVKDCHYHPIRSLMGGRKYSFRMSLETIVIIGTDFIACDYQVILEEWKGSRDVSELEYQPYDPSVHVDIANELSQRMSIIKDLSLSSSVFRRYHPGSFFPHLRRGKSAQPATAHLQAGSGRCIIDAKSAMELGHIPASPVDEVGAAIAITMKAYKQSERGAQANETMEKRQQRLKGMHILAWDHVPEGGMPWPCVVAFSLTTKSWGHVLVSGLSSIQPNADPWRQLVLPGKTKEIILSTAMMCLRGKGKVDDCSTDLAHHEGKDHDQNHTAIIQKLNGTSRYRFNDIVDSKGEGALFLLYGAPGTGIYRLGAS